MRIGYESCFLWKSGNLRIACHIWMHDGSNNFYVIYYYIWNEKQELNVWKDFVQRTLDVRKNVRYNYYDIRNLVIQTTIKRKKKYCNLRIYMQKIENNRNWRRRMYEKFLRRIFKGKVSKIKTKYNIQGDLLCQQSI